MTLKTTDLSHDAQFAGGGVHGEEPGRGGVGGVGVLVPLDVVGQLDEARVILVDGLEGGEQVKY